MMLKARGLTRPALAGFFLLLGLASVNSALAQQTAGDLSKNAVSNVNYKQTKITLNKLNKQLKKRIKKLERRVAELEASSGSGLGEFVTLVRVKREINGQEVELPTMLFKGVNVQIVDGTGRTIPRATTGSEGPNGLGNLIIGYNERRSNGGEFCSDGEFDTERDCQVKGAVWAGSHKTGSHNLVAGQGNSYSQAGGVVFGSQNTVNRNRASVSGGFSNAASGSSASVSGGSNNTASGESASISGGLSNMASGQFASVSGGRLNTASGSSASVSGGENNTASGRLASISGGLTNTASGELASISGGLTNTAFGKESSVSGGERNRASGTGASVSGGGGNIASGPLSSVSGGRNRSVASFFNWRAGELFQAQ